MASTEDRPADAVPKTLALVREPFEDFARGDSITDKAVLKGIQSGPHAEHVIVLAPTK